MSCYQLLHLYSIHQSKSLFYFLISWISQYGKKKKKRETKQWKPRSCWLWIQKSVKIFHWMKVRQGKASLLKRSRSCWNVNIFELKAVKCLAKYAQSNWLLLLPGRCLLTAFKVCHSFAHHCITCNDVTCSRNMTMMLVTPATQLDH